MTIKTIALVSAFVFGSTMGAFAANCSEPIAPAAVNGKTATKEQMMAASKDVKAFIKNSDEYQECVGADIDMQKLEAAKNKKTVDKSILKAADNKIASNQKMKEKVGGEFNTAVGDYNMTHPKTP